MHDVYVLNETDGLSVAVERFAVASEDAQLQRILEKNHDLLPGDQIDPDDPRRWLLIKREMPVPNPGSPSDCWKLDFLFADQEAIPTLVECKRFANTQSRREVIGQVIEYAANGQYYWDREQLRSLAAETAKDRGQTLEEALRDLSSPNAETVDAFFKILEKNLQEGKVRIIFFLEQSPMELRSAVDFLSKQMQQSEVFIVEARQYRLDKTTVVVVPAVFGYTDQARRKIQDVIGEQVKAEEWNADRFFADARKLPGHGADTLRALYDQLLAAGISLTWGKGKVYGTFNVRLPEICPATLVSVTSVGWLVLNLGAIPDESVRQRLKALGRSVGLNVKDHMKYPQFPLSDWTNKVGQIVQEIGKMADQPLGLGLDEDTETRELCAAQEVR